MQENETNNGPVNVPLPDWYLSSKGPQVSQTIMGLVGNILPIINFALAGKGINILPESVNVWVTLGVFVFFSVRAGIGYIRAKKVLGNRIRVLNEQVHALGGKVRP